MPLIPTKLTEAQVKAAVKIVCHHFGVSPAFMKTKSKESRHTEARFAVWYVLRKMHNYSYPTIGALMDPPREHSTIMNGVKRAIELGFPKQLGFSEP